MNKYLLGIDIGTSACKVAVFRKDGSLVAAATKEYPTYYPKPGYAEQDPQDWWRGTCEAIQSILAGGEVKGEEICGIGVDGQSWAAVALDSKGEVLINTPIWMDTRAASICERLNAGIGEDRIFDLAGNSLQPTYTTAKILWYKENESQVHRRMRQVLQSNSFIVYRLTNELTQDVSQGYGMHCFDMRTGTWDKKMCRKLGIKEDFLPPIKQCSEVVGTVTKEAARLTGLKEGTPVVAGGLDAACGALGAGVIHAGETQEQGGQAGGMSICLDTYKADPSLILGYHVVPGLWLLQGGTTGGGGVMRWFEKEFAGEERMLAGQIGESSLNQLNDLAAAVEPGCEGVLFLPYMAGERSPIWNPDAKGVFYGLDYGKTKGHMLRAAMEGVAYSLRHNLEVAFGAGAQVTELHAVGGAANSYLWTQIKADVTGCKILVPESDTATTLGAAILAGVGVGVYRDFEEAVKMTVQVKREHLPNRELLPVYQHNFRMYLALYQNLKSVMNAFSERE